MKKKNPIDNRHNYQQQLRRIYRTENADMDIPWMPLKKFRGQRQYFQNQLQEASELRLELTTDSWYHLWHWHPDMPGYSNLRYKYLKSHLQILRRAFENVLSQTEALRRPHQSWMLVEEKDFSQNALYFHMPAKPNDNFPVIIENADSNPSLPDYLNPLLQGGKFKTIAVNNDGLRTFFIYAPGRGEPLLRSG